MSVAAVVAVLVLHPVVDEAADLRVVATGDVGAIQWLLDGDVVATTVAGAAARIPVAAGPHELTARTDAHGAWNAMARPDPSGPGARYVEAWYAEHPGPVVAARLPAGSGPTIAPAMWAAAALAATGVALVAGPAMRRR